MGEAVRIIGGIRINGLPPVSAILRAYDYDRNNGELLYRPIKNIPEWNAKFAGQRAGYLNASGYRKVNIKGQDCAVHRLIWKIENGRDPKGLVDHINGIRDDNRIENLRDVTHAQNMLNIVRGRHNSEMAKRHWVQCIKDTEAMLRTEKQELAELARLKAKYEGRQWSTPSIIEI